jgi:hypothetical protein
MVMASCVSYLAFCRRRWPNCLHHPMDLYAVCEDQSIGIAEPTYMGKGLQHAIPRPNRIHKSLPKITHRMQQRPRILLRASVISKVEIFLASNPVKDHSAPSPLMWFFLPQAFIVSISSLSSLSSLLTFFEIADMFRTPGSRLKDPKRQRQGVSRFDCRQKVAAG